MQVDYLPQKDEIGTLVSQSDKLWNYFEGNNKETSQRLSEAHIIGFLDA